ncbi:MAG: DUF1127 domain-containing protein [Alphaproteobacteria bacterium]|nr:DUF1127 domain-containing protein [Alphaproteobacteria bacterium]MBU0795921.1 DUF1127 domain-containing protein [Alphaproteobacteria bacterium]MBU0886958.1 DUF1127 domain-containing protein [Alphaproteobacteria bacterium]MBU1813186.1 DUF1127 domain-containing protein [Alphaproteobacteria bacterium]MBU2090607.1 DUF1127 domain-containing protein [Alphaproteobacteria bacterium]
MTAQLSPCTEPAPAGSLLTARLPRFGRLAFDGAVVGLLDLLLLWQERAAQRHHLASLDDYRLHDVGLSRSDIQSEIRKPFWRG